MIFQTKIGSIQESDLQRLITNKIAEGKDVDYKRDLPGTNDEAKKEFLRDVVSFANTAGGHLLFGIIENNAVPIELSGIDPTITEQEILRLEEIVRTGLEPRVQISVEAISLASGKSIIALHIPSSWQAPHRISFKNDGKFYARNSGGKYSLDIAEIRAAFISSATVAEKLQNFRADRLHKIISDDTPMKLPTSAKIIIHMLPINISQPLETFSIQALLQLRDTDILQPFYGGGWSYRPNFDGLITFGRDHNGEVYNYLQIFRTGAIETVSTNLLQSDERSGYIPSVAYEKAIMEKVQKLIGLFRHLEIKPPFFVMVSFVGVKGFRMGVDRFLRDEPEHPYIDRDNLIIPEIMSEDLDTNISKNLQPIFDAVWNACGWQKCWNYTDSGEWKPRG